MTSPKIETRSDCEAADLRDPLAKFRDEFTLPDNLIYLDGNSLGVLPQAAPARAADVIRQEWGADLISSWNKHDWFELPVTLGEKIAQLVGGTDGGCVVSDTTSVNIFKAMGAAVEIQAAEQPERKVIISERENFPTDLYVVEGLMRTLDRGYELRLIDDSLSLDDALSEDVAVVLLTQVNYRTGQLWDITKTTKMIQSAGALAVWDLCHSVGAVPIALDEANADFAVGCTYKYLNGGPGSPAFVWVADRHIAKAQQPLSGWWGHSKPFDMALSYEPSEGIRRFLVGTQSIIALSTMEVGLDIALSVDQEALREKSLALTSLFIQLVEERIADPDLTLVTPRDPDSRGSHVSFRHPNGFAIMKALIANGVVGDYREPEVLRFGITPLYLGFADIWDAVETLRRVLQEELWRAPEFNIRGAVT